MPIAEVAEALFATVDANAIIECGTALQAISNLYGTLGSSLDDAHLTLFSGKNSWSGHAAGDAQGSMVNLSSANANIQSALSTIGQTLTEYGMAMQPFQKKVYPTPVPGSRDPEAAADLAIVGVASTLAAAKIGTAVVKMLPIANPGTGKHPSPHSPAVPPHTAAQPFNGTILASSHGIAPSSLTSVPSLTSPGSIGSGPLGSDQLLPYRILGVGSFISGEGEVVPGEVVPGEAIPGEGMPVMPMTGAGHKQNDSERTPTVAFNEDADFWSGDPSPTDRTVIGA